jgi:IclR family transcriptional regulator, pca regulon regulatory protein
MRSVRPSEPRPTGAARIGAADKVVASSIAPQHQASSADNGGERGTYVVALARGLAVMRAFTAQEQQLTLADVARLVELPRATVRRVLLTLKALGYVDVSGRYFSLSPQVLTIAQAYLSSSALPRVAQPFLERLSELLGESCSVSILNQHEVIYVARSARRRMASLHRDVGTHLPAYCTSMGRVLLAALSDDLLKTYLATADFTSFTPHTVVEQDELRALIVKVRRDGYSIVDQELELGLRSIAVPLQNASGRVVAALNVGTQASVTTRKQLMSVHLLALRSAAADLRALLMG